MTGWWAFSPFKHHLRLQQKIAQTKYKKWIPAQSIPSSKKSLVDAYRSTLTSIRPSAPSHTNRLSRREDWHLSVRQPQSAREREFNASMEEKAEAIRCPPLRATAQWTVRVSRQEKMRMDFLDTSAKCYKKHQKWKVVYEHFSDFCRGNISRWSDWGFLQRFQKYVTLLEGAEDVMTVREHSLTTPLPGTGQHSVPSFAKEAYLGEKLCSARINI